MFAIVKLGNQQFKVKAGDFLRAPYQNQPLNKKFALPVIAFGDEEQFIYDNLQLKKSVVQAIALRQSLSRKVLVFKKKRRKGFRRTQGHRQKITEIRILELKSPSGQVSKVETKKTTDVKEEVKKPGQKKSSLSKKVSSSSKSSHKKIQKETLRASKKEKDAKVSSGSKNSHKKIKKETLRASKKEKDVKVSQSKKSDSSGKTHKKEQKRS